MKRLTIVSVWLSLICTVFIAPSASAHVLKTDGDIGAILHINPDDSPISGTPTSYILYFDDITGRFELPHCDCTATFLENGKTISSNSLTVSSGLESDDTYAFPRPDVYTLEVSGRPKKGYNFQPFVLNYLVRVEGNGLSVQPFPLLLWVGLGMMTVLILLGAYKAEYN